MFGRVLVAQEPAYAAVPSPVRPEWPIAMIPTGCATSAVGAAEGVTAGEGVGATAAGVPVATGAEVGAPVEHAAKSSRAVAMVPARAAGFINSKDYAARLAVTRRFRVAQGDQTARYRSGDIRSEPVASQERVGALPPRPRVRDPLEAASVASQEPSSRLLICLGLGRRSLGDRVVRRLPLDALLCKLRAQRPLASWPRSIPGLDPRSRKRHVVEHPELGEPRDHADDELLAIASAYQAPPHLGG